MQSQPDDLRLRFSRGIFQMFATKEQRVVQHVSGLEAVDEVGMEGSENGRQRLQAPRVSSQ